MKFAQYKIRDMVCKSKKLAEKLVSITESPMCKHLEVLAKTREEDNFRNVWMQDGKIWNWDTVCKRVKS